MLDGVNNQNKNKENIANDIAKIKRLIESKTSNPYNIKESLYQNQKEETSNLIVEGTYREIPKEEIYNFRCHIFKSTTKSCSISNFYFCTPTKIT